MINKYNEIFKDYKEFIIAKSKYNPRVVKDYTSTSTYFPIISCQLSNFIDTDYCTIDMIEKHEEMYLTIDIYTKNKTIDNNEVASQLVNDELTDLTIQFFNSIKMKRNLCRLTPNADISITRRTIQYQGLISSTRGNIIRR
ncbi:MAG: hypothetical protein IKU37_01275 [Candidatus Gastranaerophilales bacterium]|nr:hypothetical protein [Candidatus Gastranaerophilales bacterium]